ncbi:MAG: PLP-dependent aminotransferase family protein [Vulcanimicrobiaceae bacterium]
MAIPPYADRMSEVRGQNLSAVSADAISFGAGDADPAMLPDISDIAADVLKKYRTEVLQYAARKGLPEMREWVAAEARKSGLRVTADNILVVNGAKHALDLTCKLFLNPRDSIVVTTPTYMTSLPIFNSYQVDFIEIAQDADGLIVDALEERLKDLKRKNARLPKMVYNVPEFHNPSGVTMSAERRAQLVRVAQEYGLLIVEDDPYRRIRFEGKSVAPIQSHDTTGCVIGLGTVAKLVAPGFRVGWVIATPEIIDKMASVKTDGGSGAIPQRFILEYAQRGRIEPHIAEVIATYRKHRDVMLKMLHEQLPGSSAIEPAGGYYVWVKLPEGVDGDELASAAARHGVEILPGRIFYATTGPKNFVRLAFSFNSDERTVEGMQKLGKAYAEVAHSLV